MEEILVLLKCHKDKKYSWYHFRNWLFRCLPVWQGKPSGSKNAW